MEQKRTAIVTGAYGAIGKAISEGLASKGYRLVMVGRDESALRRACDDLVAGTGNKEIDWRAVDLSQKKEIERFAQEWKGPLHVLVNNAAATPRNRQETPQGIDMQFATNVLGYFWMINTMSPHMDNLKDARIVNVASYWAGDMDLDDLEFTRRRYDNDTAYRQSKQANRMLTVAFAERLKNRNIAVFAAHPGDVRSKLSNNLGYGGWESPGQGAATPLFCATDESLKGKTGKYYSHQQEERCSFSSDHQAVEKLYSICSGY